MKTNEALMPRRGISHCGCCALNRRAFIAKGGAAAVTALGALTLPRAFGVSVAPDRMRLRIVYVLFGPVQPRPTWPNIGYDFVPVTKSLEAELTKQCPDFQFVTSMASTEEEAQKIPKEDQGSKVDGYLIYQMNNWPRVVQTIATSGKPVLYADFTYAGPANAYETLTHSEDRQGASLRSLLPAAHLVTTLQFEPKRKEILFHQARAVGNDANDRACRTKLRAQPLGDFEKLFTMWDVWGWHRVTFYGDLKEPVFALADAAGWKVVSET